MSKQFEFTLEQRLRLLTADEVFSLKDPNWLKYIQGDSRIERKAAGISARSLGEWFSMWANTPPHGGIIALGIANKGAIEGILATSQNHINDLERTGDIYCPDARCEIKRVNVTNQDGQPDQLLIIRVHYNDKKVVRTSEGHAWVRRGESKIKLKEEEIREIQIEKGELSWEREDSSLKYPDDYDQKTISRFTESVTEKQPLQNVQNPDEILELKHLGRFKHDRFIPNKACALLFAKDPCKEIPGCRIRFLRFDGKDEGFGEQYNAIKDQWIEGNIPAQLVQTDKIIESQLRNFSQLGRDGKFINSPEYPKDAWYEAIVNAVCHRSYNLKNMTIFVKMFDDRLEVESPGGFLPFVTPANIYDTHHPRNPDLMIALYFFEYVKCAHEGTRRMRQTMQALKLPAPIFAESITSHAQFKVILKNNVEHRKKWLDSDAKRVVGEVIFQTLSEHEKRVINYVAEFRKISVSDTVRITGKAWRGSKQLLISLEQRRILKHIRRQQIEKDSKAHFVLYSDAALPIKMPVRLPKAN